MFIPLYARMNQKNPCATCNVGPANRAQLGCCCTATQIGEYADLTFIGALDVSAAEHHSDALLEIRAPHAELVSLSDLEPDETIHSYHHRTRLAS